MEHGKNDIFLYWVRWWVTREFFPLCLLCVGQVSQTGTRINGGGSGVELGQKAEARFLHTIFFLDCNDGQFRVCSKVSLCLETLCAALLWAFRGQ